MDQFLLFGCLYHPDTVTVTCELPRECPYEMRVLGQVPTEYFLLVLGKHLKYSSCLYPAKDTTLDEAEQAILGEPAPYSGLQNYPGASPSGSGHIVRLTLARLVA